MANVPISYAIMIDVAVMPTVRNVYFILLILLFDNYYILAFAYRVYNAKWVKECLILENNANDVIANEREEMLSRICFQLMFAMDSYYEKGLINLTAISEYDIYKSAYSYTLGLIKRKSSSLIWTKSALENFASELHEKIIALENL